MPAERRAARRHGVGTDRDDGHPDEVLAHRRFGVDDQRWFAEASGDHNPLHLDELVARRTVFGQTVVHGVHALLWALNAFFVARETSVARFTVTFRRPIFLEEDVEVVVASEDDDRAEIQIRHEGVVLLVARLDLAADPSRHGGTQDAANEVNSPPEPPVHVDTGALTRISGNLRPHRGQRALADAFDSVARVVGEGTVCLLASLSRLVGVECPGLHSLFVGFDVNISRQDAAGGMRWQVIRYDDRVGAVRIRVDASGLQGNVDAFVRPQPAAQARSADLQKLVEPGEFEGMRALVVGGSRGLGEIVAKLVAAGGGSSIVTWYRGADDAGAVVDDIRAAGGTAEAVRFDVGDPAAAVTGLGGPEPPTHLFYFATPRIFTRRVQRFDDALFQSFYGVYVTGFIRLLETLWTNGVEDLSVFYPSTVAVEERLAELTEYAAAKAAGEIAAHGIAEQLPGYRVLVERLPRLRTDQTASVLATPAESPERLMLEQIRLLAAL